MIADWEREVGGSQSRRKYHLIQAGGQDEQGLAGGPIPRQHTKSGALGLEIFETWVPRALAPVGFATQNYAKNLAAPNFSNRNFGFNACPVNLTKSSRRNPYEMEIESKSEPVTPFLRTNRHKCFISKP
jgi:hypothetical protein